MSSTHGTLLKWIFGIWVVMQVIATILGIVVDGREVLGGQRIVGLTLNSAYDTVKWFVVVYGTLTAWSPAWKPVELVADSKPKYVVPFFWLSFGLLMFLSLQVGGDGPGQFASGFAGAAAYVHHVMFFEFTRSSRHSTHEVNVESPPCDIALRKIATLPIATAEDFEQKKVQPHLSAHR